MPNPPRGTFSRREAQGTAWQRASGQQARPERLGPAEKLLPGGGGVGWGSFSMNGQASLGDRVLLREQGPPVSRDISDLEEGMVRDWWVFTGQAKGRGSPPLPRQSLWGSCFSRRAGSSQGNGSSLYRGRALWVQTRLQWSKRWTCQHYPPWQVFVLAQSLSGLSPTTLIGMPSQRTRVFLLHSTSEETGAQRGRMLILHGNQSLRRVRVNGDTFLNCPTSQMPSVLGTCNTAPCPFSRDILPLSTDLSCQ